MPTLYLDMNVYNRSFDDQRQMRIRLETVAIIMIFALIENKRFSARWSFALDYENSRNPSAERRAFVQYLAQCCAEVIGPDEAIKELPASYQRSTRFEGEMHCIWRVQSKPGVHTWSPATIA